VLALAAGLLAVMTGCSGSARPTPSPVAATRSGSASATVSATPSATEEPVTPADAAEVFAVYTTTDDMLRAATDPLLLDPLREAMQLNRDGQAPMTAAAFLSTDNRPPRYEWGSPTFYVPKFRPGATGLWFSALATRNGHPTLLTFAKADDWRLSSAAQLLPGQKPPDVELDADGYATALAADDRSVTISPQFMGPLHATVAEAGATGVTAGLIAPGAYTTDVAEQITAGRKKAKSDGFSYDSIFSAGDYPVYALRTVGGGALIQYSLTRTTTTTTKTAEDDWIPVPAAARWAIDAGVVRRTLKLTETDQYAASVPSSKTPTTAHIIAHESSLTSATGE
jgi:hypothetical protein